MTEDIKQEGFEKESESEKDIRSLSQILGMNFKDDGSWTANDVGDVPVMRKLNRKERRKRDALSRKGK